MLATEQSAPFGKIMCLGEIISLSSWGSIFLWETAGLRKIVDLGETFAVGK